MKHLTFIAGLLAICHASAEPVRVMVIGDSQSEEYRFEVPFSAPESDPIEANTMNWIEILSERRSEEISFGEYRRTVLSYPDVRNGGYEYNWSIPGALTETFVNLLNSTLFESPGFLTSRAGIEDQLADVDVAVVFLGGNDMNSIYAPLTRGEPPSGWPGSVIDEVEEIVTRLRAVRADIPIILGNFPDVGGTQKRKIDFPDPDLRARASTFIAQANQELAEYAGTEEIPIFDVASFSFNLAKGESFYLDRVQFLPIGHPENKPRYLFCRDGFHPSTAAQATIANLVIAALNEELDSTLTPLTEVEILSEVLGMDPAIDDEYLAWVATFSPSDSSMLADPESDGLPNLGEYALDLNPVVSDSPQPDNDLQIDFLPDPERTTYVRTIPEVSTNLRSWTANFRKPPFTLAEPFFRLKFDLFE